MTNFFQVTGALFVVAILAVIAPLLGVLSGAFAGWIVGFYWTAEIIGFLTRIGIDAAGLQVWQVGAALGFLGSFFRPNVSTSSSK